MSKSNLQLALEIALRTKNVEDIDVLISELKKAGVSVENVEKASNDLGDAWDKLDSDKLADEFEDLTKATKGSAKASELHTQNVEKLEKQLSKTTPEVVNLRAELGKLVSSAAGLTFLGNSAISFEEAMAGVKKTVDGTPEEIQELSTQIKQLSVDLGLSSEAVAAIAAQGGQLGIPIEKLGEFTELAGKMAVAFDLTAEEAAEAAAKLANVFDIPITQVGALGDAINTLGNNTAAKEREIVSSMLRIGGSAKQFGLAEEQAASLAAAFISLGKPPEVAATAINALLTKLQTAQTQGDKFQGSLESIGLSADQMAQNIQANPQQALSDFLAKLGQLDKQQRAIAATNLFGQEYSDDISLLVGSLETYNKALGLTADKSENAGAMQSEFEAQMEASGKDVDQAIQSLTVLAQTLGEHLLPIISATATGVKDVTLAVNDFATNYPAFTQFAVLIASGTLALKGLNTAIKLSGALGLKAGADIAKGYLGGKTAIDAANTSAGKLNTTISASSKLKKTFAGLATKAFAVAAAFEAGNAAGDWLYDNVPAVRSLGDELGRVLAYVDAIFTDRTFDDVDKYFETSAEAAERVANETNKAADSTEVLAEKQKQAALNAENQAKANRELVNDIIITRATVEQMSQTLANMEADGEAGTQGYKTLSAQLKETQKDLENLTAKAKANGLERELTSDLEKASASFQALGLDAKEFATGISSDINAALGAYVEVSKLAGDNTEQLARAYNAVKDKIGSNAQAQTMLEQKLKQVTQGNTELAVAVKAAAQAQKDAKTATDDQKSALDALGISMEAVNAKMSKSGIEMVSNLRNGIVAIKEQATSADALKTALNKALDVSLQSAKTKADFEAIKHTLDDAGVAAKVSSEHMQLISRGIAGGSEGVKRHAEAMDEYTQSVDESTKATDRNTASSLDNAQSKVQQATASKQAAAAAIEQAQAMVSSAQNMQAMSQAASSSLNQQRQGLQQLGLTAEQANVTVSNMFKSIEGNRYASDKAYNDAIRGLQENTRIQTQRFVGLRNEASAAAQSLNGTTLSANSLSKAQGVLRRATSASINGLVRMDNQTLSNLENAIINAKRQMKSMADSAKTTADSLHAEFARMKGDDVTALKLEQNKKIVDIEEKLQAARKRGNSDEIAHYQRALMLQKKINTEQNRQAKQQKDQEQKLKLEASQNNYAANNVASNQSNAISAVDVVNGLEEIVKQSEERGQQKFAEKLIDESKRRAR